MSEFISDEEMIAMEAAQPKVEGFVSDEEMAALDEANKTGMVEAALRGAAQGLTFGFADEITAAAESAFTDKTYDQAVAERRAAYEKAKEDQAIAYNIGDYGSTVATLLAGPATAVIKGGAKLGGKLAMKGLTKGGIVKRVGASSALRTGAAVATGGKSEMVRAGLNLGKALLEIAPEPVRKATAKLAEKIVLNVGKGAGRAAGAGLGVAAPNIIGRSEQETRMKKIKQLVKAGKATDKPTKFWREWFHSELQRGTPASGLTKADFQNIKTEVQEINLELVESDDINMLLKLQYLKDSAPNPISTTIFGVEDVEVNDFEKFKFLEQVRTVFHPDYLLESSKYGALSNYVMDTLISVHPDYLELNRLAIAELMVEFRTTPSKAPKNLSTTKQGILAKIFQQPRFSPELVQQFQAQYQSQDRPEQRSTSSVNMGEAAMTNSQRISTT